MSEKLILIDGSGFIFRAYHSLPPLTRSDGTPTGAVYGFTNMLMKLLDTLDASHIAVIFDAGRLTFRNEMYDQYKANRPELPEDLAPQFPLTREAVRAFNLPSIELAGCEADDIIATYTKQAKKAGMEVVIISSDKDLMQLIEDGVTMFDAMKNKAIGAAEVLEKFGVTPDKVIEVQALIGDSVDNVPGIPGIGPKTAAELINEFGSLEALLQRANEIKQPKRRESVIQHADAARLSKRLVELKCDCTDIPPLDELKVVALDSVKLATYLKENNFTSLLNRVVTKYKVDAASLPASSFHSPLEAESNRMSDVVGGATVPSPPTGSLRSPTPPQGGSISPVEITYTSVRDETALREWVTNATAAGHVAFDLETDSLRARSAIIAGFSLCVEAGKACYIPVNHREERAGGATDLFGETAGGKEWARCGNQLTLEQVLTHLKPLLENPAVLKIGHNIKFDMLALKQHGVNVTPIEDTMLLSYCLSAGKNTQNMDDLAASILGHTTTSYKTVTGSGKAQVTFDCVHMDTATHYAAEDADITLRLWQVLKPQLIAERMLTLYETIERPLVPVIVQMEYEGVKVDEARLRSLSKEFEIDIAALEKEIFTIVGHPFTIGSPKQLGEVLFDEMKLEGGKKSGKSGQYGTDAGILEALAEEGHPIANKVLEWRQLSKLKSTYTDALVNEINKNTKRVHTSYALAVASTGRLSSSDPNLQNIPTRTTQGKKIREAFIAAEGFKLLSADYSQIELRLLAHVADIPTLKEAFRTGADIHTITASQMFGVPPEQVTGDLRRQAKTINFGIIYGISAHGLAARLGIGRAEAGAYINAYFEQYPGIKAYMESMKQFAREHGYVETLWGRRCHVPGILDKNPARRQFSERAAINAPLQGTAADIIKRAMIAVDKLLKQGTYRSRMLLQVHDELVFEIADGEESLVEKIKKAMEQAANLSVPLVVDTGLGLHWGEIH